MPNSARTSFRHLCRATYGFLLQRLRTLRNPRDSHHIFGGSPNFMTSVRSETNGPAPNRESCTGPASPRRASRIPCVTSPERAAHPLHPEGTHGRTGVLCQGQKMHKARCRQAQVGAFSSKDKVQRDDAMGLRSWQQYRDCADLAPCSRTSSAESPRLRTATGKLLFSGTSSALIQSFLRKRFVMK